MSTVEFLTYTGQPSGYTADSVDPMELATRLFEDEDVMIQVDVRFSKSAFTDPEAIWGVLERLATISMLLGDTEIIVRPDYRKD